MQRGSLGGRERGSIAGATRNNLRTSSGAPQPGYTTPNTRTLAGSSTSGGGGGGRRSYLPRLAAGGSGKKVGGPGSSAGPAPSGRLRRRSSTDNAALRSRPSLAAGGPSTTNRQSVAGGGPGNRLSVVAGGAGVGALSALARATPARNVLSTANNYLAPPSAQSNRLSCESRLSTSGRRKRQEVRPITDAAFKKSCVDNILSFLIDNGYCDQNTNVLNRRVITNPTTKDFTSIFSFIYNKLDINYKLPARFDEDIPRLLKLLQYPVQIPKSTFITVGSPHSWPTLLAMLSWLCDIMNDIMRTNPKDMAFPTDFDSSFSRHWEDLNVVLEINAYQDEQYQGEQLEKYKEELEQKAGVDPGKLRVADEEQADLERREHQLRQLQHDLNTHHLTRTELKDDISKLEDYTKTLQGKLQRLQENVPQLRLELLAVEPRKTKLQEEIAGLSEQKARQRFTGPELLSIKNHAQTSAATLQQLQQQAKQLQEKIWSIEMQQCRAQVTLAEHIQRYNTNPAAAVVGAIAHSHFSQQEGGLAAEDEFCSNSANGSGLGKTAGGLAARLEEHELQQLLDKLGDELRVVRARVMEAHTVRSKAEEDCRHVEEQAKEKKHQVSKMVLRIKDTEEDIAFTKQEIESEEAAMVQQCSAYQAEVSALRRAPKPELYTKQQQLAAFKEEMETKQHHVTRRTVEVVSCMSRFCLKVNEQLKYEGKVAQNLRQHLCLVPTAGAASLVEAGGSGGAPLREASNMSLAADTVYKAGDKRQHPSDTDDCDTSRSKTRGQQLVGAASGKENTALKRYDEICSGH